MQGISGKEISMKMNEFLSIVPLYFDNLIQESYLHSCHHTIEKKLSLKTFLRYRSMLRIFRLNPLIVPSILHPTHSFSPEFLALKHKSSILGQWFNPVSGSRKSQAKWGSLFQGSRRFTHTSKSCLSPALGRRSAKLVSPSSTPLLTCTMQTKTSRQSSLQGASKMLYE